MQVCFWGALWLAVAGAGHNPFGGADHGTLVPAEVVRVFAPAPEDAGVVYALDLGVGPDGALALLEGGARVHLWDTDGAYAGACGGAGQGPGETEGLIHVALGRSAVYGYQFPGPMVVWPRGADGRPGPNSAARKVALQFPFAQVCKVVTGPAGRERLLLAGRARADNGLGRVAWALWDPVDGVLQDLPALSFTPESPVWDLYTADADNPLRLATPRAWAAGDGSRLWVGYSDQGDLHVLGADGALGERLALHLPESPPDDAAVEGFLNTPLPVFQKSLVEMKLGHLPLDRTTPLSRYTLFQPTGDGGFLLFRTVFGGFSNVDYCLSGTTVWYVDAASGKATARGTLALPDDAALYVHDTGLYLVSFDARDRLVVQQVRLGVR